MMSQRCSSRHLTLGCAAVGLQHPTMLRSATNQQASLNDNSEVQPLVRHLVCEMENPVCSKQLPQEVPPSLPAPLKQRSRPCSGMSAPPDEFKSCEAPQRCTDAPSRAPELDGQHAVVQQHQERCRWIPVGLKRSHREKHIAHLVCMLCTLLTSLWASAFSFLQRRRQAAEPALSVSPNPETS